VTTYFVGDGLGKATVLLLLIPLLSATIGWAGAALAARIRRA
jgi:cation transporter-like permease